MGWPEFGFGLGRNRDMPAKIADVHRWRGDRDERDWPVTLIRGDRIPCWMSDDNNDQQKRLEFYDQARWAQTEGAA